MGQTVWYQDFPKKAKLNVQRQQLRSLSSFEETLVQFLVALKVKPTSCSGPSAVPSLVPPPPSFKRRADSGSRLGCRPTVHF